MHRTLWLGCFLALAIVAFLVDASLAQEKGPALKGLEQAWSLKGAWTGVVGDENKGVIYALGLGGKCVEVDLTGKTQREIKIPQDGGAVVRLATLSRDGTKALLTFTAWRGELRAYDLNGMSLWSYPSGIDDVWASDVDGDGSDEVIVGYNGSTGLHVLDSKGQLLWKSTAIGNVWHVCAGNVWGEGSPQVVTTSAGGKVHVFGSDGKNRKDLDAGCYAIMVRVGMPSEKDKAATVLVAGPSRGGEADPKPVILAALSGDGAKKWSVELPAGTPPHVNSAYLAPGRSWLAVGMLGGQVHVIDIDQGEIIASVSDQGMSAEVGWATSKDDGSPLLLVATSSKLNAFRVAKPK
jgi:outer membrane protein assembly factor BamB